jgi:hypothetical protein
MKMKNKMLMLTRLSFVSALLLAGCTAATRDSRPAAAVAPPPPPQGRQHQQQQKNTQESEKKYVTLTPLSSYNDQWDKFGTLVGADFVNTYTRIVISSELLSDDSGANSERQADSVDLPYQPRNWFFRALVGKEFSLNLSANIVIDSYETTAALATIGHQSNSDGERWTRAIHHSKSNFPLFLIKGDGSSSVPQVKVSVNGSQSYASRGAAAAVEVALGVARATGESAAVVTKLSAQSTRDQARAVDDAISKLFASGITEEHWSDRNLRYATASDMSLNGVEVTFRIPNNEEGWDKKLMIVGTWKISFDHPRPSIFSDWHICNSSEIPRCKLNKREAEVAVHKDLDAKEVINYSLINKNAGLATINAIISQQEWFSTAIAALGKDARATDAMASLCRQIPNEIVGLGLNGFDGDIVLWAATKSMPSLAMLDFSTNAECNRIISSIERNRR